MMKSTFKSLSIASATFLGFCFFGLTSRAQISQINLRPSALDILSTDLQDAKGNVLSPVELQDQLKGKIDLSILQPKPDQQWSPSGFPTPGNFKRMAPVQVDYSEVVPSGEKMASLKAIFDGKDYEVQFYRRFRNTLMRGALLEKLGYRVPLVRYMPEITFRVQNKGELDAIKSEFGMKLIQSEDWIVRETENSITFRDALIVDTNIRYYDLSQGYMLDAMVQNERKYEAVLLPWSIVDIEESMNKEPWTAVYLDNRKAYILSDSSGGFKTNFYDARWILRVIANMGRADWSKIVEKAYFPEGFAGLVTEQVIARRNSLMKIFFEKSETEYVQITVDPDYSYKNYITKSYVEYDAYIQAIAKNETPKTVTRLASPEKPELFKEGDLWSVFKNLAKGNVIESILSEINKKLGFQSDVGAMIGNQMQHKFWDDLEKFAETGVVNTEKTHLKPIPFYNGRIVYGSDVVLGNYWGTSNNLFNRVDVLGVMAEGGTIYDRTKFSNPLEYVNKNKFFFSIGGGVQLFLTRIKPIRLPEVMPEEDTSIVQLWRMSLIPEGDKMPPEQRLKEFMQNFKIGESLVLTASVAGKESVNWVAPINSLTTAFAKIYLDQQIMRRIHIHRVSQNFIQVYVDDGKVLPFKGGGWEAGINLLFPVIGLGKFRMSPDASTNLILVDLRAPQGKDKLVHALGHLFRSFDLDEVRKVSMDLNVEHELHQNGTDFNLFTQSWNWLNTSDSFKIELPNKLTKSLFYKSYTQRTASNPINFSINIFNALWAKEHPNSKFSLSKTGNVASVESPLVPAESREIRYEHELTPQGDIYDQNVVVRFNEKGPSISRERLSEKLVWLNEKFGAEMFSPERFAVTRKVLFYDIDTQMIVHQSGLLKLLSYSPQQILDILNVWLKLPPGVDYNDDYYKNQKRMLDNLIYRVQSIQSKFRGIQTDELAKDFSEPLVDLITILLDAIPVSKFIQMVGGTDNVYITGKVSGFRTGDENTFARPVIPAQTIGRVDKYPQGPLAYYSQSLEIASQQYSILPFEVLAQWMIRK